MKCIDCMNMLAALYRFGVAYKVDINVDISRHCLISDKHQWKCRLFGP